MLGVSMPIICALSMVYILVPESSRYLALQGRYKDAASAANRIAYSMGCQPGRELEVEELHHYYPTDVSSSKLEQNTLQKLCTETIKSVSYLYVKHLRTQTILVQLIFSLLSFGSGLGIWINTFFVELKIGNVYLLLVLFALANIPGNIVAALLLDVIGRKQMMFFSLIGASASLFVLSWIISFKEISPLSVIISSCVYHAFLVCIWCSIFVMTSEVYPTSVRNTAMGVCVGSARLSGIATQFVYGALIKNPSLLLQIASTALFAAACVTTAIKTPDMTNKPLNDEILYTELKQRDVKE